MLKRIMKPVILTVSLLFAVLFFSFPTFAAEKICDGCAAGSFNDLPACVKDGNLHICENNFPDENFRKFLIAQYDTDQDSFLTGSQVDGITSLSCNNRNLTSLEGIGYFSNLANLFCSSNQLTELDLSANKNLVEINCIVNQIKALTVPKEKLQYLFCNHNDLTELDLSNAQSLRQVMCSNNNLTSINLEGAIVRNLSCNNNKLGMLDLSNQPYLVVLNCNVNRLTNLILGINQRMYSLRCESNNLTALDISGLTNLEYLYCGANRIASLNIRNRKLFYLDCHENELAELDLRTVPLLNTLNVDGNKLNGIDLSACPELANVTLGSQTSSKPAVIQPYPGTEECTVDLSSLIGPVNINRIVEVKINSIPQPAFSYDAATATVKVSNYISTLSYVYRPPIASGKLAESPTMLVSVLLSCNHTWTTPTCTTPSICTACNQMSDNYAPHSMRPATATYPESCSFCGYYEKSSHPLEHVWIPATCTKPERCEFCDETNGSALGHTPASKQCGTSLNCSRCGRILVTRVEHEWESISCTRVKCKKCGKKEISDQDHIWSKPGLFTRPHCLNCGETMGSSYIGKYFFVILAVQYALELTAAVWYLLDYKRERKY